MLFLPILEFLDNAPIGRSPCYHHNRDAALTDAYGPIHVKDLTRINRNIPEWILLDTGVRRRGWYLIEVLIAGMLFTLELKIFFSSLGY